MANCLAKSIHEAILKYEYINKTELLSNNKFNEKEITVEHNAEDLSYNIEDITKISEDNQIMFII